MRPERMDAARGDRCGTRGWMRHEVSIQSDADALTEALHDRWIDVDGVEKKDTLVSVPITEFAQRRASRRDFTAKLVLSPVAHISIEDKERVGYYDIHSVQLIPGKRTLRIQFNISLKMEVIAEALPIRVEIVTRDEEPPAG